ncbi:MAG: putative Ig domain-containing protein [Verrucomicrobiales bacterium]|nr:putative Ig domain-containing protein [Verrucomicrobiales bacterium]
MRATASLLLLRTILFVLPLLGPVPHALSAEPPVSTWTGASFSDGIQENDNHFWENPANWDPIGVPDSEAIVVIPGGQPDARNLGMFTQERVDLRGGTLTSAGLSVRILNQTGGGLAGNHIVGGDDSVWTWTRGPLHGAATVAAGATMDIVGDDDKWLADKSLLRIEGILRWAGTGRLMGQCRSGAVTITVADGGELELAGDGQVFTRERTSWNFQVSLDPGAVLRKSAGTINEIANIVLQNAGEIRVDIGRIELNAPLTVLDGARLTGPGRLRIVGGRTDLTGTFSLDEAILATAGGEFRAGAGGATLSTRNGAEWEWSGGWLGGTLTLGEGSRGVLSGEGDKSFADSAVLNNRGTLTWTGGRLHGYCRYGPATLRNLAGARFIGNGGTGWSRQYASHPGYFVVDAGAVFEKADANAVSSAWAASNHGEWTLAGGELWCNAGGSSAGGTYRHLAGAIVGFGGGTHTLTGPVSMSGEGEVRLTGGEVQLDGALDLEGVAWRQSGGTFRMLGEGGTVNTAGAAEWEWSGGWLGGTLTLGEGSRGVLSGEGDKSFADSAVLHNRGTLTWTGGRLHGYCRYGPATLRNLAGARFIGNGGTGWSRQYASHPGYFVVDAGAVFEKADANAVSSAWAASNHGEWTLAGGELWCNAGGSSAGGTYRHLAGASVGFGGGTHTLTGPVSMSGEGEVRLTGGEVQLDGALDLEGVAWRQSGGTFRMLGEGGTVNTAGAAEWEWSGGWLGGTLTLGEGSRGVLSGEGDKSFADSAVLHNRGTLTWTGGRLHGYCRYGPATLRNLAGARFIGNGGTGWSRQYASHPGYFVVDAGAVFEKADANAVSSAWAASNHGEWTLAGGELWCNAGGSSAGGTYRHLAGAIVGFGGGTHTLTGPVSMSGEGEVRLTGGEVQLDGALDLEGVAWRQSGGTFRMLGEGGTVNTAGAAEWEWSGGWLGGTLTLGEGSRGVLSGEGDKSFADSAVLHNRGTLTWTGGRLHGYCRYGPATLWNHATGVLIAQGEGSVSRQYGSHPATFQNDGALLLGAPDGTVSGDWRLVQTSTGTMELRLAGDHLPAGFGRWSASQAVTLDGELRVTIEAPFQPGPGDAFPFLAGNLISGRFARVVLPALPEGVQWLYDQARASVTLRVGGAEGCVPPLFSLVGWWPGDGSGDDLAGPHPGNLANGVTFGPGVVGEAFQFDGVDDYVDLGAWSPGVAWSVEAWVNCATLPDGRHTILGATDQCLDWGIVMESGEFATITRPASGCSSVVPSGVRPEIGEWHHVVGTYDGTTARVYVDGELRNSSATVAANYSGTARGTRIGGDRASTANSFAGLVDEAAIYDYPLEPDVIAALYAAGASGKCHPGDLRLRMTATPEKGVVGEDLTFRLEVTNLGPGPAADVRVIDALPSEVEVVEAILSQGTFTQQGAVVDCELGGLGVDAVATIDLRVRPTTSGWLMNAGSVRSRQPDPDPANNQATLEVLVTLRHQDVLFVNVHGGGYEAYARLLFETLELAGARATWADLQAEGQVAEALAGGAFDQIWVFDLSGWEDLFSRDWQAIADWFADRPGQGVICDARIISSYWTDRHLTHGALLTENYYENLKIQGGGLVLTSDDALHHRGINTLNGMIGLAPFSGDFAVDRTPVDTTNPLMSEPNDLGADLPADCTPGQVPFGLQPGGLILYGAAWINGDTNRPCISSTLRGGAGFRTQIASPAPNSFFNEEEMIRFEAHPVGGVADFSYQWTSDLDGLLGDEPVLSLATLTPGAHHITLLATDGAGAADVAYLDLTVRFVEPAVSARLTAASDTGQSATDHLTAAPAPTVEVTINKRGAIEIDWQADGVVDETVAGLAAGTHPFVSPAVADGAHPVAVGFLPARGIPVGTSLEFTVDTRGARVVGLSPDPADPLVGVLSSFETAFDSAIDPSSFAVNDVQLSGPGGVAPATSVEVLGADRFRVRFPEQRLNGPLTVVVGPGIADLAGNAMDQDGDGEPGETEDDGFRATYTVSLPDLAVSRIQAPPTAVAGESVTVEWTLGNVGATAALASWRSRLFLSDGPDGSNARRLTVMSVSEALPAGATLVLTTRVSLPTGLAGTFHIGVAADIDDAVPETDESNNTRVSAVGIELQAPDLVVDSVRLPAGATVAGQSIPVEWVVRNVGTAPAAGAWHDRLFLERPAGSAGEALPLGEVAAPEPLTAGERYTNSFTVTLPLDGAWSAGDYSLVVSTDSNGAQPESDELNNLGAATIQLSLPPLPDLTVTDVTAPAEVRSGEEVTLVWQTVNTGPAALDATWHERLVISNALQGARTLVEVPVAEQIESGLALNRESAVALPPDLLAGEQWFHVVTDSGEVIMEESEANNAGVAAIAAMVPASLRIELPTTRLAEGSPRVPGRVVRNSDPAEALTVTLSHSDAEELEVDPEVTIPAGETSTTFEWRALPDQEVDADAEVTLQASADGHEDAETTVTVLNLDIPQLTLTLLAGEVMEGTAIVGRVSRTAWLDRPIEIHLANAQPVYLVAPDVVVIPAQATAVEFAVEAIENDLLTGTIPGEIRAASPGFHSGAARLDVLDNDLALVTLIIEPAVVAEDAGPTAVVGTVHREPVSARPLVLDLESSDVSELRVPPRVIIGADRAEATFLLAVVDDDELDGDQTVRVTPFLTASGSGTRLAPAGSVELTVVDDEGPALKLVLDQEVAAEGLDPAMTGTVFRNTPPDAPLEVTLASSDPGEANAPPRVTIPSGAPSVTFPVATVDDGVSDGNQTVTLTAAAAGFSAGAARLVVSDVHLPDLVAVFTDVPESVNAENYFTVTYRVRNQGLGPANRDFLTMILLSDDPVAGEDALLEQHGFTGSLPAGRFVERSFQMRAPRAVGDYWLVVRPDAAEGVVEMLEANNAAVTDSPLRVTAPYRATVLADLETAPMGTRVPLRGRVTHVDSGQPVPAATVHVHVTVRGSTRVLAAVSDAQGDYSIVFSPLPNEAGRYTVGADHPGVSTTAVQDTFELIGFRAEPASLSFLVPEDGSHSGAVKLHNLGESPLHGLTVQIVEQPVNLTVETAIDGGGLLAAGGEISLGYTVRATDVSPPTGLIRLRIESAEDIAAQLAMGIRVEPRVARLIAEPTQLSGGMARGSQRAVFIELANLGAIDSGPITVSLPPAPWLQLAVTNPLPSLPPGETNRIKFLLTPSEELELGDHQGSIVLACPDSWVTVPYSFRVVSEARGDLRVEVSDEYTYYAENAPMVAAATVRLTDQITHTVVGEYTADADGVVAVNDLVESYYVLDVTAPEHSPFQATIYLPPGETTQVDAFLPRQAVTYTWTVVPTEIEDRTRIQIETTFEAYVPMPVVTLEPELIDLTDETGDVVQFDLTLSNHGLVAAQDTAIAAGEMPGWRFTPLITEVGELPAMSSLTIPVVAERVPLEPRAASGLSSAGKNEDCWTLMKAIYELVCWKYKTRREVSSHIHDANKCPPSKPLPKPPSLPDWVKQWTDPVYPPPPAPEPSGWEPIDLMPDGPNKTPSGYQPAPYVVEPAPKETKIPWYCDPCMWDILDSLISCGWDFVNPIPDTVSCGKSAAECATNPEVLGCAGALNDCLAKLGAEVPVVGTVLTVVGCLDDLLGRCGGDGLKGLVNGKLPKPGQSSGLAQRALAAGDPVIYPSAWPASMVVLDERGGRLLDFLAPLVVIVGDPTWFHPGTGPDYAAWMSGFDVHVAGETPEVRRVTPAERNELLSRPFPEGVTADQLHRFIDRWNRTVDYNVANVFDLADVPVGESTDFIARDVFRNAVNLMSTAIEATEADGFTDPVDAILQGLQDLRKELADPANEGICGRVTLKLDQEAVISRDAFEATLEVNNASDNTLGSLAVEVIVMNESGQDVTDRFGLRTPTLSRMGAVDGTGEIAPHTTASAVWVIIPSNDAAPETPVEYYVSGVMRYVQDGVQITVPLTAVRITVHPNPRLHVKYFHQRDVYADDPFTEEIEPSLPFSLAVMVENHGFGGARNLRITSAQPEIVENDKGLLIDFQIIGSEVEGEGISPSLTVNLGHIGPGENRIARWLLTSTLQGLFVDYQATFEHLDDIGELKLSLIEEVTIHEMIRTLLAPGEAEDGRADFLVNDVPDPDDLPDTLYLSTGETNPVRVVLAADANPPPDTEHRVVELTAAMPPGWGYLRIPEPSNGTFELLRVVRADGRELVRDNDFWVTDRVFVGLGRRPRSEWRLHLLDQDSTGRYTLYYAAPAAPDVLPPVSSVAALPPQTPPQVPLAWDGADEPDGSGIAGYDVFVSEDDEPFRLWLRQTRLTTAVYPGNAGRTYAFFSVAVDNAGNRESPPAVPDARTATDEPNRPPVLTSVERREIVEGARLEIALQASDPDGDPLTYSLRGAIPKGATINASSGVLSWATDETTGPAEQSFTVRVSDGHEPPGTAETKFVVEVTEQNTRPRLTRPADGMAREGRMLTVDLAAMDLDLPAQTLRFRLGAGAPAGMSIDANSGRLSWRPSGTQGGHVHRVRVEVEDDGEPSLSDAAEFSITVADWLPDFSVALGQTNVFAGGTNALPVWVRSEVGLSAIEVDLHFPVLRLLDLELAPALAALEQAAVEFAEPDRWRLTFSARPGEAIMGDTALAWLGFAADTGEHSAVVPMAVEAVRGWRVAGDAVDRTEGADGRVWLVAQEPLVDLRLGPDGILQLVVYGHPQRTYGLQSSTRLHPANWEPFASVTLSEDQVTIPLETTQAISFLRAAEQPQGLSVATSGLIIRRDGDVLRLERNAASGNGWLEETAEFGKAPVWRKVRPWPTSEAFILPVPPEGGSRYYRWVTPPSASDRQPR